MSPDVFAINKSFPRVDIHILGQLRILGHQRFIRDVRIEGNVLVCPQELRGFRETVAATSNFSISIRIPLIPSSQVKPPELKLMSCKVGVMFVVVNHSLDFFYFADVHTFVPSLFRDGHKYENFKSIEDAMDAYNVYEIMEEL